MSEHGPGWVWPPARKLDAIAASVGREWGIAVGPRFSGARYSFAGPVGDGAVRLLRHDRARRALLIERCVPGDDASTIDDDAAMQVALAVGRRLWRPFLGGPFRTAAAEVARWLDMAARDGHPLVAIARDRFGAIGPRHDVLVHGDFHHHNLLRQGDRWLAIDPKPLLAEPEFDVVTLLWNPIDVFPTRERTERRIAAFVAAGLDVSRSRFGRTKTRPLLRSSRSCGRCSRARASSGGSRSAAAAPVRRCTSR